MIINTKTFQETTNSIALAVNDDAANLELVVKDGNLRLNISNKEYFCCKIFPLENPEDFHAVVDAKLFLQLISGITTDTFDIKVKDNTIVVKAGKSSYKLAMIYENDSLATIAPITIANSTVNMSIKKDILLSILNVNGAEVKKVSVDAKELQKYYYIDETGCFCFSSGACLNSFTLDKPIKLLLTDQVVRLFKLFKEDVVFTYGIDALADGSCQAKVVFNTSDTYVAAIINCNDALISQIQGVCAATKNYIDEQYSNHLVISASTLLAAINRLLLFTKNSISGQNMKLVPATVTFTNDELTISDNLENSEVVQVEAGSYADSTYSMIINIADLKLVLESCKNEHITLNCGNHRSIVITRGAINNIIPECRRV